MSSPERRTAPRPARAPMYTVADVMTRELVTLKETDDLALADRVFGLRRIRHLPVVRDGRLVGLITHRDLLRSYVNRGESQAKKSPAGEMMTTGVTTVLPDTSLRRALKLMLKNKFGCLPVVAANGKLVGLITEADLVRFAAEVIAELDKFQRTMNGLTGG
ncbi:MAG: CBS domain-containing protein [Myxococcaceae bacterium]